MCCYVLLQTLEKKERFFHIDKKTLECQAIWQLALPCPLKFPLHSKVRTNTVWFHKHYLEVTTEVPGIVGFIESESTVEEARGRSVVEGRGNGGLVFNGDRLSV